MVNCYTWAAQQHCIVCRKGARSKALPELTRQADIDGCRDSDIVRIRA